MTKVTCPTCFNRVDRPGPHRRFHVVVSSDGDEWKDVVSELRYLLHHIEVHGPTCSSVSGGYATAHFVVVTERPEQTHEKWEAELEAHLAAVEQEEAVAK